MKRILINETINEIGQKVKVSGWVNVRRDHGKIIFIDLRDVSGLLQIIFVPNNEKLYKIAETLRTEWVVSITGTVNKRPDKMVNNNIETGNVEMLAEEMEVLSEAETLPFEIDGDGYDINEEVRLKYRYLDLRRARLQKNIVDRHRFISFIRNYLNDKDFVEVETPILTKSTPEGARDYVVPSRLEKGKFYALPQSPQQYKQLLMIAGVEKYYQFARAMRDEDTRGDRQPEHTQLDMEMSFVNEEDILNLLENLFNDLVRDVFPEKNISQKPWPRLTYKESMKRYGTDKPDLRKDKNNPDELAFCWITDFPLFEYDEKEKRISPMHHMFTAPKDEDVKLLDKDPLKIIGQLYDAVCNGSELASGSIRINKPKIQQRVFEIIGMSSKVAQEKFGHLLDAYQYGAPPHGGIAFGVDRFLSILQNEPNIREVIAFPKTGEGKELMMDTPSEISKEQLEELGIKIVKSH